MNLDARTAAGVHLADYDRGKAMTTPATELDDRPPALAAGRIEVRNLTKKFGDFKAVDDLSFTVEPGRITGFLGPNGAGKTTTLRMVLGLIRPTAGTALIGGKHYVDLADPLRVVGAALEATNFHPGRTGRDHLRVLAAADGIPDRRVDEMLELVGIPAAARKRAGSYSMGMRQRLGLAAALLGDPSVLVLDEPTNGLDPEGIRWLRGFLRRLSHEGKTILISSHLLGEVEATVDDVVIISNGRLIKEGPIQEVRGESSVFVKTPDVDKLTADFARHGVNWRDVDGGIEVALPDPAPIGDAALRLGVRLHELRPHRADLESLFFQLTEGQNRNLGDGQAAAPVAAEDSAPQAATTDPEGAR